MLELRHLNTLTALRAHGSLAAAADELHVTASAVSHQLKELENYYDISLVNRRTRPLLRQQVKRYWHWQIASCRRSLVPNPILNA
ncbi:LysR family transcriptional regulator [Psychrobacter sp. WY6]|uniref:helix-turn-helix domain-containing protein n=1 Tax=Psychrobacter sp. WY6 TaxID=2708350 RepID=UPI0032E8011E